MGGLIASNLKRKTAFWSLRTKEFIIVTPVTFGEDHTNIISGNVHVYS